MTSLLNRWLQWFSPSTRHRRQLERDYVAWAQAQRELHGRASKSGRHK
jgi:hypothetical protein